jgi:hypothetical protein
MLKEISIYLTAEKQESLLFVLVGVLAIGVSVWLWMNGHRLKTMAFPLIAIALIQILVGGSVYLRTDNQIATLNQQLSSTPAIFKAEETKRMEVVMQNFKIYKAIEIGLLLAAVGILVFFKNSDVAVGIGAGLVLQSAFMLCLDMFAESRGGDYVKALLSFAT